MKVRIIIGCFFSIFCFVASAQSGTWIWMNGSNTFNTHGTYGTQGVASVSNCPPGLYQAAQWTDKQGNYWIFGGISGVSNSVANAQSDLWEFDPVANIWTWVKGPGRNNQSGIYGTLGVPSPISNPGARGWGCAAWTDTSGDLWLFSGDGFDSKGVEGNINDLWRYNIASNEWTWMGGSDTANQLGVFGTFQQASDSSLPMPRSEANTAWTDANNNLWLFGGYIIIGDNDAVNGDYNDLWRYNVASGQWTWMSGFSYPRTLTNWENYGTLGVESATNFPSARPSYTHWIDLDSNYLYFTGGGEVGSDMLFNDVWRFNINTNYWTWVGGINDWDPSFKYSNYCTSDSGDVPQPRFEHRSAQVNGCRPVLFMWGGALSLTGQADLNDLWSFDPHTEKWRWISGYDSISPYPSYGVKGVASPSNMPPGAMGACFWGDNNDDLWLWGGWTYNKDSMNNLVFSNAMWKYIPDPTCFPSYTFGSNLNYQISATSICPGDSALVSFTGGTSISISPTTHVTWVDSANAKLTPDTTTTFAISGSSLCGSIDTLYATLYVIPHILSITATPPGICDKDSAKLCATNSFDTYNWSNGDSGSCTWVRLPGVYSVTATVNAGCSATATRTLTALTGVVISSIDSVTSLCGNGNGKLTAVISVGVAPFVYAWSNGNDSATITGLDAGQYSVTVTAANGCTTTKSAEIDTAANNLITIAADKNTICTGDTAQICAATGFASYNWSDGATTTCINTEAVGNYYVTVTQNGNCTATSNHVGISMYPTPQITITEHADTLTGSGADSYQWLLNGTAITGATLPVYVANQTGTYSLQATDSNGCMVSVSKFVTVLGITEDLMGNSINIYPNPTSTGWQLSVSSELLGSTVEIFDATGRLVFKSVIENQQSSVNFANAANGVYQLRITWQGYSFVRKLIKL